MYGNILVGLSFLSLTFLTVKTFAPDIKSNAETQNISETVGPYTMSMSNDTVASITLQYEAPKTRADLVTPVGLEPNVSGLRGRRLIQLD